MTLLVIASKVLSWIMLDRMKLALDSLTSFLRDEQSWNTGLYLAFIDFEKAFHSVVREAMWRILQHYGVPGKIINVVPCIFSGFECQMIHDGSLTELFQVRTGVRHGCLLSLILFLVESDGGSPMCHKGHRGLSQVSKIY